jgi:hypothetical protein
VPAVVITYSYWEQQFGLDPNAVGEDITVNGQKATVAGVLRRSFRGLDAGAPCDIFLPMARVTSVVPEPFSLDKADN